MSNNREYDYLFKLVIIGDSGVGKSSLLLRFADDSFSENYITTIGVDFRYIIFMKRFKTLKIDNKGLKLQIWDTAGQERFRTITNAYYKGADAYEYKNSNRIIIVYSTTDQASFDNIENFWLNEVESYAEQSTTLLLLGNKSDLGTKQVSTERAQAYATQKKMEFYETSAKTADMVEQAFNCVAKKLMIKRDQQVLDKKNKRKQSKSGQKKEAPEEPQQQSQNLWTLQKETVKQQDKCAC